MTINVLVLNSDVDGVGFFRLLSPYLQINNSNFKIEVRSLMDYTLNLGEDFLKDFNIIVYNKNIPFNSPQMEQSFYYIVKKYNIKIVYDIDDHWLLDSSHINYKNWKDSGAKDMILKSIKNADLVTTTTSIFAKDIAEINKNVEVLPNAINLDETQWLYKDKNKSDKIRFLWGGGISHLPDIRLLTDSFKLFDKDFLNKCQLYLCGFDLRVKTQQGMMKDDWHRSTWTFFEDTFTNKYKWINNNEYRLWLMSFDNSVIDLYGYNEKFGNEFYQRRWTKPILWFGTQYRDADVCLAPLKSGLRFNSVKCIIGDSLISTIDGFLKIEDIVNKKINTKVLINNKTYNIVNYFKYEDVDTIKIITKEGYNIEGTSHHKLYINDKWIELSNLKINDNIELQKNDIVNNKYQYITYPMLLTKNNENKISNCDDDMIPRILINEKWGRLLGYLMGDGHIGGNTNVSISCDKRYNDVVVDIKLLFEFIGLKPLLCEKIVDKRCVNNLSKEGFGIDIKTSSKTLVSIARKYNWIGKNGKIFRIPDVILKSPKSVIIEFLRGLFESDGTVGENSSVSLTSKDLKLIEQIQILLLSFNIQSTIDYKYNKHYNKYYYTLNLRRQGSDIFYKEIGFISKLKTEKLKKLVEGNHSNNETKQTFKSEIVKIEYNKNTVYDIEVEEVHSYVANGLINHNSQLKLIEAGAYKCPLIASNFGPYTLDDIEGKITDKQKGILIDENDKSGWWKAMKWYKDNPQAIIDHGETNYEYVKENYEVNVVNAKRMQIFEELVKK